MVKHYMGVDPSTVSTGFALLNEAGKLIKYGTINPPSDMSHEQKLWYQYGILDTIVQTYYIEAIVCEDQFNGPNVDTLKKIARTSAVLMIIAAQHNIQLEMMYPVSWRKLFHKKGNATKKDTITLANEVHNLELKQKHNDIADAIGMAHACRLKYLVGHEV
jgi:Holliday junction resolvasome RuvABC endonuclease subunit